MMHWQKIETAPKDGTDILLYVGLICDDYGVAHWNEKEQCWDMSNPDYSDIREFGRPTHWMPLPDKPTEDSGRLHPDDVVSKLCDVATKCGYDIERATLTWFPSTLNTDGVTLDYKSPKWGEVQ